MDKTHVHKLVDKLGAVPFDLLDDSLQRDVAARKVVTCILTGMYQDLPGAVVEEIRSFARLCITEGAERMILGLKTRGPAMMLFAVDLVVTQRGLEITPAAGYSMPDDIDDIEVPKQFLGLPVLAIDLTVPL